MRIPDHYNIHNYFVFDGKSSMDFDLGISGDGTFAKPHRRVERFTIPGRNGTLTISDDTFEDVEITYPCYFANGFAIKYQGLMDWLYSKKGMLRLEDTYHPEHFRLAEFVGDVSPDMGTMNFSGRFDLTFRCDGRLFLKSGEREYFYSNVEEPYQSDGQITIVNPTNYKSYPLLITNSWIHTAFINEKQIVYSSRIPYDVENKERQVTDCESGEVYFEKSKESLNQNTTFADGLPCLYPGENVIRFGFYDTDIAIEFSLIPRFYTI